MPKHPYQSWEDYRAGMYDRPGSPDELRDAAYELLTDIPAFTEAMTGMLAEWPIAAEHRLASGGPAALSWLGAAACMWKRGAPERATRAAWWLLTGDQMDAANTAAERARVAWLDTRTGQEGFDFDA